MSAQENGGPAFPRINHSHPMHGGCVAGAAGMTLRDYFAGAALTGTTSSAETIKEVVRISEEDGKSVASVVAEIAYEFADAMLAAREAKP